MRHLRKHLSGGLPRGLIVLHDLAMVAVAWFGLHWWRFGLSDPNTMPTHGWAGVFWLVLAAQALVFWWVGLYRGLWRFASTPDLFNIFKACAAGILSIAAVLFAYNRLDGIPRSVLLLYPATLALLLGVPRLAYRTWKDARDEHLRREGALRVLILGAGRSGESTCRELRRSGTHHPVGFLDDAALLKGARLHGLPVLGRIDEVTRIARETAAGLLVIAMPSADADALLRIVSLCEQSGVPFRMVPKFQDMLDGKALPQQLKHVDIEDLLGREPVVTDWRAIREWLGGRSVLITGAGGSIGSELARQCARQGAAKIAMLEHDELSLMRIEAELQRDFPALRLVPVLGDCGDEAVARHALELAQADTVFHAAAYKQVPILERQLREAVRNNSLATHTMATAAAAHGVATFVLVSTDKAVDPVNVLGATKRLAEMACQRLALGSRTHFITVRFGNVLDSAGSVVPLFREQVNAGGPVTVTHPDVTRYFMTIPEACLLILKAGSMGSHEAIYTLDMGRPVRIRDLAEQMIRLAGKEPGRDVQIIYTGLRPGEKLHETLFHAQEDYGRTSHPKILQGQARQVDAQSLDQTFAGLRGACARYDVARLGELLREAVPEFNPDHADGGTSTSPVVIQFPSRATRPTLS